MPGGPGSQHWPHPSSDGPLRRHSGMQGRDDGAALHVPVRLLRPGVGSHRDPLLGRPTHLLRACAAASQRSVAHPRLHSPDSLAADLLCGRICMLHSKAVTIASYNQDNCAAGSLKFSYTTKSGSCSLIYPDKIGVEILCNADGSVTSMVPSPPIYGRLPEPYLCTATRMHPAGSRTHTDHNTDCGRRCMTARREAFPMIAGKTVLAQDTPTSRCRRAKRAARASMASSTHVAGRRPTILWWFITSMKWDAATCTPKVRPARSCTPRCSTSPSHRCMALFRSRVL